MTTETSPTTEAPNPSAADASASAPAGDQAAATTLLTDPTLAQPAAASTAEPATQEAPAADTKADGEQKPTDEAKPAGAPEKYEFTAPEGTTLDAVLLSEFEGVARELDLPQDKAQQVVDKLAPKVAERMQAQTLDLVTQARTAWADASKTDKEIGGDKLAENLAVAEKAMATFGTPELRKLLDESGLGNHPEMIRVFVRAGKAISEDRPVLGSAQPAKPGSAQQIYAASNMNP